MSETVRKKNKGGRPRLEESQKKKYAYGTHLDASEAMLVERKKRKAGIKKNTEFVKQALFSAVIFARLPKMVRKWIKEIAGMANNINQLTKVAHKEGFLSVYKVLADIKKDILEMQKQVKMAGERKDSDSVAPVEPALFLTTQSRRPGGICETRVCFCGCKVQQTVQRLLWTDSGNKR